MLDLPRWMWRIFFPPLRLYVSPPDINKKNYWAKRRINISILGDLLTATSRSISWNFAGREIDAARSSRRTRGAKLPRLILIIVNQTLSKCGAVGNERKLLRWTTAGVSYNQCWMKISSRGESSLFSLPSPALLLYLSLPLSLSLRFAVYLAFLIFTTNMSLRCNDFYGGGGRQPRKISFIPEWRQQIFIVCVSNNVYHARGQIRVTFPLYNFFALASSRRASAQEKAVQGVRGVTHFLCKSEIMEMKARSFAPWKDR